MSELLSSNNLPEYSVSEISQAVKRCVEDTFSYVRVRGEISGCKQYPSGHIYMSLKDDKSVLSAVCWKGMVYRLAMRPEDGLEVICSGRLTTYPGRSNYQLVIESMEPAGQGALMMLLEKRKAQLAQEGLFAMERKQPLPRFPKIIGIVTSPAGAVIRDILHRLEERYPCHVIVWPVAVQGDGAAQQVSSAIAGFNALSDSEHKPDVIIVARGGGSIEDLWAFNEEIVVRAVASSSIPVISAIGHETDVTLIDYAADLRAPTPTAAAELATPVRSELIESLLDVHRRLYNHVSQRIIQWEWAVNAASGALRHPQTILEQHLFRLDDYSERLVSGIQQCLKKQHDIVFLAERMKQTIHHTLERSQHQLDMGTNLLSVTSLTKRIDYQQEKVNMLAEQQSRNMQYYWVQLLQQWKMVSRVLKNCDYKNILARGFTIVRNGSGAIINKSTNLKEGETVSLEFQDKTKQALIQGEDS